MRPKFSVFSLSSSESKQRFRHCLLYSLLLVGYLFSWVLPAVAGNELSIGIFPRRDASTTRAMFQPMMEYLGRELVLEVKLDVPPDFDAFWSRLKEKQYDLVHLNQYQYLRAHQGFGYQAILMNEEMGRADICSVIWVRNDGDAQQPVDLKGKKIVFGGGKHAMISHIMAVDLLRQHGLSEGDYLAQHAINPVSAMLSLYYRQSVAAGAGDVLPHLLLSEDFIPPKAFKPLLQSQPVAQLPWAVSLQLSDGLTEKIQRSLLRLKQTQAGRQMLSNAGLSGFVMAEDSDYDPLRRIVAKVLKEHY